MKRIKITILFAMVVLFIPFLSQAAEPGPRTITVVGESTVKVAPDNVLISLTVETINPDLKVARSENNSKIKSVLELCKKENIESDNIKTSQISVSPKYKYESQKNIYEGMQVSQSLGITLKDISRYNSFLDKLLSLKTRYIHSVDFKTSELKKYREQARSLALNAAKEKAEKIASGLSQRIGKPITIQEGFVPDSALPYFRFGAVSQSQNISEGSDGSGYNGTGLIDVSAMITITFELTD